MLWSCVADLDLVRCSSPGSYLVSLTWLFCAVYLAGSGIRTQSPFRTTKGLHGSTLFTLSLPVTRLRLLAVRAGFGLLAVVAIIAFSSAAAWILFPLVRAGSTPADFLRWLLTTACCAAGFHAMSVLVSTVLDEMWQIYASFAAIFGLKWLTSKFPPPPSLDVFRVMTTGSPLLTHAVPWPAVSVCLCLAGILFLLAARVVETNEY